MGFYHAPNGRLLTLAFYGHSEDPFNEGGIGRVVREIYQDGKFGPMYFIRYSSHTSWNEKNTAFPFYRNSKDHGFIAACDSLLSNQLMTLQWRDEDLGLDDFYSVDSTGQAFSWYRRADGNLVGLWKWSLAALSFDDGKTFSDPVKVPTLVMDGGKVWGQQTEDGRYAISYNPINNSEYRYPMTLITSDDGIVFDNLLLIQGEVPPRRFYGRWKDFGPCYMRGIVPGNGDPPGNDFWLSYSMNKEDIWVCRVPVPVRYKIEEPVNDDFEGFMAGGPVKDWNLYAPLWASVELVNKDGNNLCMQLSDRDPYDYTRAIRVVQESEVLEIEFRICTGNNPREMLQIDVTDRYGNRPVRLCFDPSGKIEASDGSEMIPLQDFVPGKWYKFRLKIAANLTGEYSLQIDDRIVLKDASLAEAVQSVERVSFRTGAYRDLPNRQTPNETPHPPLPGADDPAEEAVFWIDDFKAVKLK
jgi:hypothetical protein